VGRGIKIRDFVPGGAGTVTVLPCVNEWSKVAPAMQDSKPKRKITRAEKDRRARQAASLRKTLATRGARARMSAAAKRALADPEVRARRGAAIKNALADPSVRARMSVGIRKAWTPERRAAQGERMTQIMGNPEQNARRIAGLRRSSSDPELKALRIANLKKALADPVVNKRRIEKMKQTLRTPEMNARRSATLKKMHADARAGLAAMKKIEEAKNRGLGRPPLSDKNKRIEDLKRLGLSPKKIASQVEPDYAENPKAATERVKSAWKRIKKSKKKGGIRDEPEALHDGRSLKGGGREAPDAAALD
jgi:hypothetical protein